MSQLSVEIHPIPLLMSRAYLIAGSAGMILVDAGMSNEHRRILRAMHALGRHDLRLIFITHAHIDHYGSAASLRRITGASIAIHAADADAMMRGDTIVPLTRGRGRLAALFIPFAEFLWPPEPAEADIIFEDGWVLEELGILAHILHTPGHTPGSSTLIIEDQIAFVGDLLTAGRRPSPQRYFANDWDQIANSIKRLRAHSPRQIYAAHGARVLDSQDLEELFLIR